MKIGEKTIGELIDQLITVNIRCWHAQDGLMDESLSDKERLDFAILAQKTNARRTILIRTVNERLEKNLFPEFTKSYGD